MLSPLEILWLQVQLHHHKQMVIGCCYRTLSAAVQYTDDMCQVLMNVTDRPGEIRTSTW